MSDLRDRIEAAHRKLEGLTREVCGACTQNCCHQGTMMGSQGLRRLYKGILLDPEFGERLRHGLILRREEVEQDLHVAERVAGLLGAARLEGEDAEGLQELQTRLRDMRQFVEYMGSEYPLTAEGMSRLLLYSAVRSNLLRCLRQFPGGEAALANFSQGRSSFKFRGRKIAPPRCIFHHDACLAEAWKPIKCANFFCASDPNLLARCRQEMSFDEFVLANIRLSDPACLRRLVELENDLGKAYWEPKVIIGPQQGWETWSDDLIALIQGARQTQVHRDSGRFMRATRELLDEIASLPADQNVIHTSASIDGAALYELAVAMDRARGAEWHGGFCVLAQDLVEHSFMPHPLWDDEMISQPLGGLEVYLV